MDIIRCFAFFSVVSIHFFLNGGFYEEIVSGWIMYIMVVVRSFTRVCVPLFLLLSGYLMYNRQPTGKYYAKLGKTVGIYVISSIFCLLYRYLFLHQQPSPVGAVIDILCYVAAPYSWYIEMYVGLFLFIPFLNILYQNIRNKKGKLLLILVLLVATALPSVTNIFSLSGLNWWLHPSSSEQYFQVLPDWWTGFYPITYYFIGCYLREYPIKLRLRYCVGLTVLTCLVVGTFNFYRSYGATFIWGAWQDTQSLLVVVQTVLVFTLFCKLDYGRFGPKNAHFWSKLSNWTLGAYLVSWIFDDAFYPILAGLQPNAQLRFFYMPVIVLAVCVCSLALSALVNLIYSVIEKLFITVKRKWKAD